ncbi:MAG: DUF3386 domain-containing protein [Gemmataceae bacterium]|nr:DUF3386 domain-containing protein [Gemmataceae bacterium]MDW8264949.1 DUF3386 family protein [Gemmataceae bacterium]
MLVASIRKLAVIVLPGVLATVAGGGEPTGSDPAAEKLIRDAHLARSSWDSTFPGLRASLAVWLNGEQSQGAVVVHKDGSVEVQLPNAALADWAKGQLESIVSHRQASVQDKYQVAFVPEDVEHPLGRLVRFLGSRTKSVYRIKDDLITEVHRDMGPTRFTITVTEVTRNPGGKYLPRAFNVSYWDGKTGELVRNEDYHEDWGRVGSFDVPQRRLLVRTEKGKRSVGELRLTNIQLNAAKAAP